METIATITHYWRMFRGYLGVIILLSILSSLVAYNIVAGVAKHYQAHFSYVVSLAQRESSDEFRFDGYYALQATDLFSQTVAEWITTPEIIVAAYKEVGLEPGSLEPHAISQVIDAKKTAPQLVEVTVEESSADRAQRVVHGLQEVMKKNVESYDMEGIPAITFRIVPTQAWIGSTELSPLLISGATFVFVLFLLLNILLLFISFGGISKDNTPS